MAIGQDWTKWHLDEMAIGRDDNWTRQVWMKWQLNQMAMDQMQLDELAIGRNGIGRGGNKPIIGI